MADNVYAALKMMVNESLFMTIPIDESTVITNHKYLVAYAKIIDPESFQPSTHFILNIECFYTTGAGIAKFSRKIYQNWKSH